MWRAILLPFLLLPVLLAAQQTVYDETRILYKKELHGGLMAHGDGWGANFFHGKHRTARSRRMIGIEIVGMKHPKEIKSFNPYYEDARGYFYGKLNSVLLFRPTWGRKELITDKLRKSGVEVNYVWGIGPSIAMLKPVYLQIGKPSLPYETIAVERYDPEVHYPDDIFGRASWFKGIEESKFRVGGFARFGLNFEHWDRPLASRPWRWAAPSMRSRNGCRSWPTWTGCRTSRSSWSCTSASSSGRSTCDEHGGGTDGRPPSPKA